MFETKEYDTFIKLVKYLPDDIETVDIQAELNGKPVTRIGDNCFYNHSEIKRIRFPISLERIEDSAFEKCAGIKKLILPSSVSYIGINAFRECTGLSKVVLSPKLKVLNQGVFSYCQLDNTEFIIPNGLQEISDNAFFHGGHFKLTLPRSVTKIGMGAFYDGPIVSTFLKEDNSWREMWPYRKRIILKGGAIGEVIDYSLLSDKVAILSVSVEDEEIQVFFPSTDKEYRFSDGKSQDRMAEYIIDGQVNSYYNAWIIGALEHKSFYKIGEFDNSVRMSEKQSCCQDEKAADINKNPVSKNIGNVTFGKEMGLFKLLVERRKVEERILSEAYDWAEKWRIEYRIYYAQPVQLTFKEGDYIDDGDGFKISVFYKKSTGQAILRRDWIDEYKVSYNILTNYDEIARIAPKSLRLMLRNGLELKERWEDGLY